MIAPPDLLAPEFQRIRDDLGIPKEFPPAVLTEAGRLAARDVRDYGPLDETPFVTIDPPTSRDLDQALFCERVADGYVVRYAIDDVGFFVLRGSAVEAEAWRRGLTLYSPDLQTPLYPPVISEGASSLLPDEWRPAIVFDFQLDVKAAVKNFTARRALVRSRAKLSYPAVNAHLDQERGAPGSGALADHEWSPSLTLLEEIGRKRERLEARRGGVSLRIPAQQVQRWSTALTGYRLAFEESSQVEGWNAQISLMTGMAAAQLMLEHGEGLLRALDPPRTDRVRALRLTALALGVAWPEEMSYPAFIHRLDPQNPTHALLLQRAAKVTGGARYMAFDGVALTNYQHAAIAAPYAHVTAPLRRLADRYVLDLIVAVAQKEPIPDGLIETLHRLPPVMDEADRMAKQLESRIVDFAEARLLQPHVGELFGAVVIDLRRDGVMVQITQPPVRAFIPALAFSSDATNAGTVLSEDGTTMKVGTVTIALGQALKVRLDAVDPQARSVSFCPQLSS